MSIRTSTLITAALLGLFLNAGTLLGQSHGGHGHTSIDVHGPGLAPS